MLMLGIVGITFGLGLTITNHDNVFEHWYFTFNYYFGAIYMIVGSFLTPIYLKKVMKDAIKETLAQHFQVSVTKN